MDLIKLNIGSGDTPINGFIPIDRKHGHEAYPLDYADGTVDEIRASHILEHFSHGKVSEVLNHWVAKLKPGGCIRIAVPNFMKAATDYLKGENVDIQRLTMGGHVDENDRHGCIFDDESLRELMINAKLERIGRWNSEIKDAAAMDLSLNYVGYKAISEEAICEGVRGVLSAPRYGVINHFHCAIAILPSLNINYSVKQGAYWHQILSEEMEKAIKNNARFILTCDYDTFFTRYDVLELYRLMLAEPEAHAIVPVQMKRFGSTLFNIRGEDGKLKSRMLSAEMNRNLLPITTGHFGMTMHRVETLLTLPRPWMNSVPDKDGRWGRNKVDADMNYWYNCEKAGLKVFLAPKVKVPHLQEVLVHVGANLKPVYQSMDDYLEFGAPPEIFPAVCLNDYKIEEVPS